MTDPPRPIAPSLPDLSSDEIARYSRHILLPEIGMEGQRRLKGSSVLSIGAGGLGSPLAIYLAAAGVGRIGIVDFDLVDPSNLQRQILHDTEFVGRPKSESAAKRLSAINPMVQIEEHETRICAENALELVGGYDVVADGSDNFPTRYLVNDACVLAGKPYIYGSIFRFEGQASVFNHEGGPCYRCLFPQPPSAAQFPSCSEAGVLGILPGLIGVIQATETVKVLLGLGTTLSGRLLLYDALSLRFQEMELRRDPGCALCGEEPSIRTLVDLAEACPERAKAIQEDIPAPISLEAVAVAHLDVHEASDRIQRGWSPFVLDVRTAEEAAIASLDPDVRIPLNDLARRLNELPRDRDILVHCKGGLRSATAASQLSAAGFASVYNLDGGILAWAEHIDPRLPKY